MDHQFTYCFTEGKPETLVLLKNPKDMPQLIFCPPEDYIYVWVGKKHIVNSIDAKQQVQKILEQTIYHYQTVDLAVKQLSKGRPQVAICIVSIQLFKEWRNLNNLQKVKTLYFYSETDDLDDLKQHIRPLKYKLDLEKNNNNCDQQDGECSSQEDPPQIQQEDDDAKQWASRIYSDNKKLSKRLVKYKGKKSQYRIKVLPNFIFMDKQIGTSHCLVRTLHSLLNQKIDHQTTMQINTALANFIQHLQKIVVNMKINKYDKQKLIQFINCEANYSCSKPENMKRIINWYTQQTFFYKLVNNLLRSHRNPTQIFYVQPFVKLLFTVLKQLYIQQSEKRKRKEGFECYRGGKMNEKQFEVFSKNKNKIIQNLGFLSTSLNRGVAERFKEKGNTLFQIDVCQVNWGSSHFGYADISQFSRFGEQQILFNPLNSFEIVEATKDSDGNNHIQLKYRLFDEPQNHHCEQMKEKEKGWKQIAKLQQEQKILNICQGNAMTNQYYNLSEGAESYWDQYLSMVKQNMKEGGKEDRDVLLLKKSFGLFNKNDYHYFHKMQTKFNENQITESYTILQIILSDKNEIANKFRQSAPNYFQFFVQENSVEKNEEIKINNLSEYQFFQFVNFDSFSFLEQHKYKISETINLSKNNLTNQKLVEYKHAFDSHIKSINLRNNNLTQIDESIFLNLFNLTQLDISCNRMTKVPSVSKLQKLEYLFISYNKLFQLPRGLQQLKMLKVINLNGNQIKVIDQLVQSANLQQVHLQNNQISQLPKKTIWQSKLIKLYLDNNLLSELPDGFFDSLTKIQQLSLSKNRLNKFYENIKSLQQLKKLNANYNLLQQLPTTFGNLKNLQELYISDNQLKQLSEMVQLSKLKKININNNKKLTNLPVSIYQLSNLKQVYCKGFQISQESDWRIARILKIGNYNQNEFCFKQRQIKIMMVETILQLSLLNIFPNIQKIEISIGQFKKKIKKEQINMYQDTVNKILNQFNNSKELIKIKIRKNQIQKLPQAVRSHEHLQILDLSSNKLTRLPDGLAQLKKLRSLRLNINNIKQLPPVVTNLENLQELDLSNNLLQELPIEMTEMQNLNKLNISNNPLSKRYQTMLCLPSLNEINIGKVLKDKLPQFINIKVLFLSRQLKIQNKYDKDKGILTMKYEELRILPNFVFKFAGLLQLDLSCNRLNRPDSLPGCLARLQQLRSLRLNNNNIKQLPPVVTNLENLQELDLSKNMLTRLPDRLAQLKKLRSLRLQSNYIDQLPAVVSKLENLQELDISKNTLTSLPDDLAQLKKLRSLSLNINQINQVPFVLSKLENLQFLQFSQNLICHSIKFPVNLKQVTLISNKLCHFPSSLLLLEQITKINISNNHIFQIPRAINNLKKLHVFDISHNQLRDVPDQLFDLSLLQQLNLFANRIKKVPKPIRKLVNLKSLNKIKINMCEISDWELKNLFNVFDEHQTNEIVFFTLNLFNYGQIKCFKLKDWNDIQQLLLKNNKYDRYGVSGSNIIWYGYGLKYNEEIIREIRVYNIQRDFCERKSKYVQLEFSQVYRNSFWRNKHEQLDLITNRSKFAVIKGMESLVYFFSHLSPFSSSYSYLTDLIKNIQSSKKQKRIIFQKYQQIQIFTQDQIANFAQVDKQYSSNIKVLQECYKKEKKLRIQIGRRKKTLIND